MKPCESRKKRERITKDQERLFRDALGEGKGTEEAANVAGLTMKQAVWVCRRDPLMQRLVDQEASLDQLQRQAKAVLNDATNPQSSGAWDKNQKLRAAKLVIDTVRSLKPELLTKEPVVVKDIGELAAMSRAARTVPGTDTEQ